MQFAGGGSWERRSVEGEEAAEGGGGGEGADAGDDVAGGGGKAVGQLVERILDRGAERLEGGPVVGPRRQAGIDRLRQLTGQVGAEPAQAAGAGADCARGRGRGGP